MKFNNSLEYAQRLDDSDNLAKYRDAFYFPKTADNQQKLYFCGNSLGLQPKSVANYMNKELDGWKSLAVEGFFSKEFSWCEYQLNFKQALSRLLGCQASEVTVMNSLTINLHLMLTSFYKRRTKILMLYTAFPSDRYAVSSFLDANGFSSEDYLSYIMPDEAGLYSTETIKKAILNNQDASIILIEGVHYLTGQVLDIKEITQCAHQYGLFVGLDLAHAIGNIPLFLDDWQADFAVWCSYKYLNGGPGAIGGCYINQKHHHKQLPRLAGWWGSDVTNRFSDFDGRDFIPALTIDGWQVSTLSILNSVSLRASLDLINEINLGELFSKSYSLTHYLLQLINERLDKNIVNVVTPFHQQKKGAQLSLAILNPHTYAKISDVLSKDCPVIFDLRGKNMIRVAPVPLYNSHQDVWHLVNFLVSSQK